MYTSLSCPDCRASISVIDSATEAICPRCSHHYVFYHCGRCSAPLRVSVGTKKFTCPWCDFANSVSTFSKPTSATAAEIASDIERYGLETDDPLMRRQGGMILLAGHGADIPVKMVCTVTCSSDGLTIAPIDRSMPEVRYSYRDLVSFEVGGPGLIQRGGGFIGGGFGIAGAAVLNTITTKSSIRTLVRITADRAYYVLFTGSVTPEALSDYFGKKMAHNSATLYRSSSSFSAASWAG